MTEFGGRGGTRTPDLLVRSQALYPTELHAHVVIVDLILKDNQNIIDEILNGIGIGDSKKLYYELYIFSVCNLI